MTEHQIAVTALGNNQYRREAMTTNPDGSRHVVTEQWTGNPDGPAAYLVGSTVTMYMNTPAYAPTMTSDWLTVPLPQPAPPRVPPGITAGSSADEMVRAYVAERYREENPETHLADCPDLVVTCEANDGFYGCDTGCEYYSLEATLACPHGEREEFEYGEFGEIADIIRELEDMLERQEQP